LNLGQIRIVKISYDGKCGPSAWTALFQSQNELKNQSPINIETKLTVYDETLNKNPLTIYYDMDCCSKLKNTGHTFQVDTFPDHNTVIRGGPVKHEYKFMQFHMHWGG